MAIGFVDGLRRRLRELRTANGGNVTLTFALATIPLIGFVGAAVDYSHGNAVKSALQSAADATALMLSKNAATLTESELQSKADDYFQALFVRPDSEGLVVTASYEKEPTAKVSVKASTIVKTDFMGLFGIDYLKISTESQVKWGNTKLRVALVLDTTGSMADDGKIDALKTATKKLLDQLKTAAVADGDVYVSIVPFSKDVNVDNANYAVTTWIDWTEWDGPPPYMTTWLANSTNRATWAQVHEGSSCPFGNSSHGFRCQVSPTNGSSTTSSIPSTGTYAGYICPTKDNGNKIASKKNIFYNGCYNSVTIATGSSASCGTTPDCYCGGSGSSKVCRQHSWIKNNRNTWNGCVTDRGLSSGPSTGNYDTNVVAPSTSNPETQFAAEQYELCSPKIMTLNYDWSAMKTYVDSFYPAGNTNQGLGLAHGWMSLVGGGPYPTPPPEDPKYKYTKAIILMSDGLNTQNRWSGSASAIDGREAITCQNAKDAGIVIFTVQVNTGGDPTQDVLKNCASKPTDQPPGEKFFELKTAGELVTTFNSIGTALSNLRIAY
jgi:Flp pilus assembly protein TadG